MSNDFKRSLKIMLQIIMGMIPLVFVIIKNQLGIEAISLMVLGIYFLTGGIHKLANFIKNKRE